MENQHYCMLFTILFSMATLCHGISKITQLQMYMHETLSGPNPTNIQVASAQSTPASQTFFGLVAAIDNPIREGKNPDSNILGRAQGLVTMASKDEVSIHMSFEIVFTGVAYNGSTISVAGRNPFLRPYRELSIVGGNGAFKMARGYIGVTTVAMNSTTGDGIFQYDVTVFPN